MREWNEPELWNLKVEETEDNGVTENCFIERTLFAANSKPQHWCHAINDWHDNGCGHPRSNHHQTPDNPDHNWDGQAHTSKCCCGGTIGY